jgi:hypothetical protein
MSPIKIIRKPLDLATELDRISKEISEMSAKPREVDCFTLEDWSMELAFYASAARVLIPPNKEDGCPDQTNTSD